MSVAADCYASSCRKANLTSPMPEQSPRRQVSRPVAWMSAVGMYASAAAGILLTFFVVLSAIMRYFIGAPFHFSDELVGLLLATTFLLALPNGLVDNSHLRITILADRLPRVGRVIAKTVANSILVVFAAVFLFESYKYTAVSYKYGARSEMAEILLYPWMGLMTLVSALMILIVADNVFQIVRELINQRDSK
ncbi:MAG TPA: TRAP transporter small permease [Alphaproteobacteria bacterium]|nr:TRAP transporter small permease [Alphaproteobacteria bacterium]